MRPHLSALFVTAALGVSCAAPPPVPGIEDGSADPVLVRGREIWGRSCASCHAPDGSGARGPSLQAIEVQIPVFADQVDVVADGRGSMPGFGGRYSPEELAAVVRYTREVL